MKLVTELLLFGCSIVLTGCGSFMARIDEPHGSRSAIYPGTCLDGQLISSPFRGNIDVPPAKRAGSCAFGLIDMPLSVSLDTLLLPYDAATAHKRE